MASDMPITRSSSARGGKFLTFGLADEEYGVEILKVQEIIGQQSVTSVPQTPDFVSGIINLRGRVLPVLNLRARFGLSRADVTKASCIIVVRVQEQVLGIEVDRVSEVATLNDEQVEAPPALGAATATEFLLGVAKSEGRVRLLLDIDHVVALNESHAAHAA